MLRHLLLLLHTMSSSYTINSTKPNHWEEALDHLPAYSVGDRIPAFYFAHGSPMLIYPQHLPSPIPGFDKVGGPNSDHAKFLQYFGKFLIEKYKPKAILVFSAHWETRRGIEVMGYEKNSIYYDYSGFPDEMFNVKYESKGDPLVAARVVELLKKSNIPAVSLKQGRGLDHGVFVPFKIMFNNNNKNNNDDVPVVEVSMHSLDPQTLIDLGKALTTLRDEGVLILAGGLSIHSFKELVSMCDIDTVPPGFKDFEKEIVSSIEKTNNGIDRNTALKKLPQHPSFRRAHPREDHFVPIYIAAGAGSEGGAQVVCNLHGRITIAFGL